MSVFAADWGTGEVLWSMLWFFLFFIWLWTAISVFGHIFRSQDLSGWAKALWTVAIIVFPFMGVLAYLIVRGDKMAEHARQAAQAQEESFRSYVQQAAGSSSSADELEKLARLRDQGVLSQEEFAQAKARALA